MAAANSNLSVTQPVTACASTQCEEPAVQRQDAGHVRVMHGPQVHDGDNEVNAQKDESGVPLQSQEQQRLQQTQHEQQRLLLQRSCNELQSEVKALQDALLSRQSELEMLRARVAEAEVPCLPPHLFCSLYCIIPAASNVGEYQAVCDDLRLDKARQFVSHALSVTFFLVFFIMSRNCCKLKLRKPQPASRQLWSIPRELTRCYAFRCLFA